jgi:hypothetical protein
MKKTPYDKLNSRQREVFNFQQVAALLAEYGFNCIRLSDDWQGADFLAVHEDGRSTLKVQLKSRIAINKKYRHKSLYMAFPVGGNCPTTRHWYLIAHDDLLALVKRHTSWLTSESWQKRGGYSSGAPNPDLVEALGGWRLGMPNHALQLPPSRMWQ